ncbi:hypothetical protein Hypma_008762 [Hypsizygus marmoreus]|uniref:Uncharacterized protein n=1 Tax=Hypsizygus marmoreus TaxID=39966 RepID=A0A369JQG2_HYPMA|nr:hypothetical protein Hypma_008762 [Hypsizygus marmoreus]
MVHLVLSSLKGNQGLRYFPYVGYLGLTPVRVEGYVRTKLDDDAKQLQATSITISVRCYESRIGRVSVLHSNILADYTQVLWSKPDGQDYAPIEDLEFPFRITVPAKAPGFSTAVFVDYRCMWRIEAVLNHVPISGVGSRQIKHFELPLIRFDLPPHRPTPSTPLRHHLQQQTTKPKAPRLRYYINAPTTPIGPLDIVSIPVHLLPVDDGISIRSTTVMIERRIQLYETAGHPHQQDTLASPQPIASSSNSSPRTSPSSSPASHSYSPTSLHQDLPPSRFNGLATIASDNSSDPTITPLSSDSDRPLLSSNYSSAPLPSSSSSSSQIPSKTITTPLVGAESSGKFLRDDQGVWSKTVTLQWPAARTHSRWAIGESVQSELVSVKFFARVKISVSSANGTESIELLEKELLVVSTNDAERQLAVEKYNDLLYSNQLGSDKTGRSKSKSPRRSRRDRELDIPPSPAPFRGPGNFGGSSSTGSVTGSANGRGSSGGGKVVAPRRPHTSAGPRDNKAFTSSGYGLERPVPSLDGEDAFRRRRADVRNSGGSDTTVRPESSHSGTSKRRSGMVGNFFSSGPPRISTAASRSSTSTTSASGSGSGSVSRSTTASSVSSHGGDGRDVGGEEKMREWEEELAKIEMLSRQSSDMVGFAGRRKRSAGAPRIVEPGVAEV